MMHHLAKFLLNHQSAGFSIDSFNVCLTVLVLGNQSSKFKINAEAFVWWLDVFWIKAFFPWWDFLEFCLNASSALVWNRANSITFELWDTIATLVSLPGQ